MNQVHLNKNYNFKFLEINTEGDVKINNLIKNYLKSNTNGSKNYNLYLNFLKKKKK